MSQFWIRLEWLRGALAIYVLLHHVKILLWPARRELSAAVHGADYYINAGLSLAFRFGLFAVLCFFLISGMSIHARAARDPQAFRLGMYFRNRLLRLYPALIFSLASCGLLAQFAGRSTGLASLVGTFFFQQGVLTTFWAGNTPYWSLANEGYYYAVYPLLLLAMAHLGRVPAMMLFITGTLALSFWIPLGVITALYPIWLAGALLMTLRVEERKMPRWLNLPALALLGLGLFYYQRVDINFSNLSDLFILCGCGICMAPLLDTLLDTPFPDWMQRGIDTYGPVIGKLSYALYLNHYVLILLIRKYNPPNPDNLYGSMLPSLLAIIGSLALAALSYYGVERVFLNMKKNA